MKLGTLTRYVEAGRRLRSLTGTRFHLLQETLVAISRDTERLKDLREALEELNDALTSVTDEQITGEVRL